MSNYQEPSYVKDLGLKPKKAYASRKKTDIIIQHHASGKTPKTEAEAAQLVRDYHQMHMNKGNRGIDYNYLVSPFGGVYKGRGLMAEGGHVLNGGKSAGMNARSIGICALGDLEKNHMPEAQKQAIIKLTRDLCVMFGIKEIIKHKQVKDTDCPGKFYPFEEIKIYALGGASQPETSKPAAPAYPDRILNATGKPYKKDADVVTLQKRLAALGFYKGDIDGKFGPMTLEAVKAFQQVCVNSGTYMGTTGPKKNGVDGSVGELTWEQLFK